MGKEEFIASLILVSILFGGQAVEVARANPIPWQSTPNQEKPVLTVFSPKNNTVIDENNVTVSLDLLKPDSWNKIADWFWYYVGQISYIDLYLDGNLTARHLIENHSFTWYPYTVTLNQTTPGQHTLNVTAQSYTYYRGPPIDNSSTIFLPSDINEPIYQYPIVVFDTVNFTVTTKSPPSANPTATKTPSPTPTQTPSPSPTPTPTSSPSSTDQPTAAPSQTPDRLQGKDFAYVIIPAAAASLAVAAVGLLFHFRKRRG